MSNNKHFELLLEITQVLISHTDMSPAIENMLRGMVEEAIVYEKSTTAAAVIAAAEIQTLKSLYLFSA